MQRVLLVIDFKLIIYQTITSTKKKNKCCVTWAMAQITPDDVAQFTPMPDFQQKTHLRKKYCFYLLIQSQECAWNHRK